MSFEESVLPQQPSITRDRYFELPQRAKLLSWLSVAWMTVGGAVAIAAGVAAGSIALVGFGLDSAIEGFASLVIVWRFTGERVFSHAAERRAQKLVAIQFFVLAPYVVYESISALIYGDRPDVSWVGIGLAVGSVILMPVLGIAKQRLADSSVRRLRPAREDRTCSAPTSRRRYSSVGGQRARRCLVARPVGGGRAGGRMLQPEPSAP